MSTQDPAVQEILDSLSLAARHLATAASLLTRSVDHMFSEGAANEGAAPPASASNRLLAGGAKRARMLSANALQVAEAAANVAGTVHSLSSLTGNNAKTPGP